MKLSKGKIIPLAVLYSLLSLLYAADVIASLGMFPGVAWYDISLTGTIMTYMAIWLPISILTLIIVALSFAFRCMNKPLLFILCLNSFHIPLAYVTNSSDEALRFLSVFYIVSYAALAVYAIYKFITRKKLA